MCSCCKVHAILLRHKQLAEGGFNVAQEESFHFFRKLCDYLHQLEDTSCFQGADALEYRCYVLQKVMELCVPNLVQLEVEANLLQNCCEVFIDACGAADAVFLQKCLCKHSSFPKDIDLSHSSKDQLGLFIISQILCAPMFREFSDCQDGISKEVPLHKLIELVASLYDGMSTYASLWVSYIPNCNGLLIPGLIRMFSVVLWVHWGEIVKQSDTELPSNFVEIIDLLFNTLEVLIRSHLGNRKIMGFIHLAVEELDWLNYFGQRRLQFVKLELEKLIEAMLMNTCWYNAKLGQGPHSSAVDIFAMFYQLLPPINSMVTSTVNELFYQYIADTLGLLEGYADRVIGPLEFSSKLRSWEKEFSHLTGFVKLHALNTYKAQRLHSFFIQLDVAEVVLRLNTVINVREHLRRYFASTKEKHAALAFIAGCPELNTLALTPHFNSMDQRVNDLAEFLAIRIVSYELKELLFTDLYRLDMRFYKQNKGNKKLVTAEEPFAHLVFLNPNLTMAKVLEEIDNKMMHFLLHITEVNVREVVVGGVYFHFLLALYQILVDGGEERYFYPAQSKHLFSDLCAVEQFFQSAVTPEHDSQVVKTMTGSTAPQAPPSDSVASTSAVVKQATTLLNAIKCIISLVMAIPSEELINGSEMNLRYQDLPELSSTSPMCKYIVRHVLAHRKDQVAKKFTAAHHQ